MKERINILVIWVFLFVTLNNCSQPGDPIPGEGYKGASRIFIALEGKKFYSLNEDPCEILPGISSFIGDPQRNLIQVPIYVRIGDLAPMVLKVYVENLIHSVNHGPDHGTLLDKLVLFQDQINEAPHEVKIIMRVEYAGRLYSNSWDTEYTKDSAGYHFIRDRTGLRVEDVKISEETFECLPPGYRGHPLIRLQARLDGPVVTEDLKDTVTLTGAIDLYLTSAGI